MIFCCTSKCSSETSLSKKIIEKYEELKAARRVSNNFNHNKNNNNKIMRMIYILILQKLRILTKV